MALRAFIQQATLPAHTEVVRLSMSERLSAPFDLEAVFALVDPDLDTESLLGAECAVEVLDDDPDTDRAEEVFHGVIEEAEYLSAHGELHAFRVRLRPRLHGLAYRVRTRIFQEQSVVDVVRRVLREAGLRDESVVWHTGVYPVREYVTQWKESELAFVQRLLDEAGIFYWFAHTAESHVLHLADSGTAHEPIEGDPALPCAEGDAFELGREAVTALSFTSRSTYDAHRTRDWNPLSPSAPQAGFQAESDAARLERYEFGEGFLTEAAGMRRARDRMMAEQVTRAELAGRSNSPRLAAGRKFELVDVHPTTLAGRYLLWSVERRYANAGFQGEAPTYAVAFRAMPSTREFRPSRTAPRPRVPGKESAVVTGPTGEEIHVDALGRIKVHFYWDREGAVDDTASCWVRVQQPNTASSMALPRIGWEVDVGFLYGDPDRPVAMQKVYNQETLPPYGLPDNLMQSSWQSSTSPGGGGTNEVRMNDGNGGMEFFVHAQKDYKLLVGHNLSETIGVDAKIQVGRDASRNVGATESVSIGGNQSTSVTGTASHETVGDRTIAVGGDDTRGVTGMYALTVGGARTESIGSIMNVLAQKVTETFNAGHTRTVGGALSINSGKQIGESVAGRKFETIGGAKVELVSKAKSEDIKAAKSLTAGLVKVTTGADITVAAEGALAINAGGPITIKCDGDFNASGSSVTVRSRPRRPR
jgi:type VI secretion system secreted protein VgrG